jgi:hypothetical protein
MKFAFLVALPILWFLAIGRYGWSDTDDGFILSYSWRIVNGELPYKDFIYVRPPLSPLLHSIWFSIVPTDYVYAFTRLIVILEIEIYCLLGSFVLCKGLPSLKWAANDWFAVTIASFLVSVSQFTPMAWHTVDGILFSVLGLSVVVSFLSSWTTVLSAVLMCLAAMTKQSFYPMPIICLLYLILAKRRRDVAVYSVTVFIVLLVSYVVLNERGMWPDFLNQTVGASSPQEAIQAGFVAYAKYGGRFFLAFGIGLFCLSFATRLGARRLPAYQLILLFVTIAIGLYGAVLAVTKAWVSTAPIGCFQFLFIAAVLFAIILWFQQRRNAIVFFLFLTVSWCASISWGFRTPALFSPPLLLGGISFAGWFARDLGASADSPRKSLRYLLVGVLILALLGSVQPYRDIDGRLSRECRLGEVEEKFRFIVSGPKTCDKLAEFNKLATELDGRVIVLPAFPLANFVLGHRSPMPLDWPMTVEMGKAHQTARTRLEEHVDYILLDTGAAEGFNHTKWHVPFIELVKTEWKKTFEGHWYAVYENPSKVRNPLPVRRESS